MGILCDFYCSRKDSTRNFSQFTFATILKNAFLGDITVHVQSSFSFQFHLSQQHLGCMVPFTAQLNKKHGLWHPIACFHTPGHLCCHTRTVFKAKAFHKPTLITKSLFIKSVKCLLPTPNNLLPLSNGHRN